MIEFIHVYHSTIGSCIVAEGTIQQWNFSIVYYSIVSPSVDCSTPSNTGCVVGKCGVADWDTLSNIYSNSSTMTTSLIVAKVTVSHISSSFSQINSSSMSIPWSCPIVTENTASYVDARSINCTTKTATGYCNVITKEAVNYDHWASYNSIYCSSITTSSISTEITVGYYCTATTSDIDSSTIETVSYFIAIESTIENT